MDFSNVYALLEAMPLLPTRHFSTLDTIEEKQDSLHKTQ